MVSNIDSTIPITGTPTTASVRLNFATAASEITALQAQSGNFLPIAGGSVTGTVNIGTGQPNYWTISGSGGSPLISVTGAGNQFAQLQGNGVFGPLLQSDNGNILRTQDDGGTGGVTNYMQLIAGTGTNAIQIISTNNAAGMRFLSPVQFNYNWAWNNATSPGASNVPFQISNVITGLANTGSTVNLMPISINDQLITAQVLTMVPVIDTINGGGGARTALNAFVFANSVTNPATWQLNFAYTVAGTVIQNQRNIYRLITPGTSAATGLGPTGSAGTIPDGSCVWAYVINLEQYNYYNGGGFVNKCNVNLGGTSFNTGDVGAGFIFGAGIVAAITNAAATYIGECTGMEIDCWCASGSSVGEKGALKLVIGTSAEGAGPVQGFYADYGLMFNSQHSGYGVKNVIQVGSYGFASPLVGNSYILQLQERGSTPPQFSGGIDLRYADVSGTGGVVGGGFLWASNAGAKIDGEGNFISGYGYFGWDPTAALIIDCAYQQSTGATMVSAGNANYQVGSQLIDPISGTRISVDSITGTGTSGSIATFHINDNGWAPNGSIPTNPVTFNTLPVGNGPGTLGSGATFNLTWTQRNALSLMPSGGPITAYGTIQSPGNTVTGASTPIPPRLAMAMNLAGTFTGAAAVNTITVSSDTADASGAANGGAFDLSIVHNAAAGLRGGRANIWTQMNVGAIGTLSQEMLGVTANVFANASTNTNGALLQALSSNTVALANSTVGSLANEFDYHAAAGSSVNTKFGLQITLGTGDLVQGTVQDAGLAFSNANRANDNSPGMNYGIQFGIVGQGFPLASDGTLIGMQPQLQYGNAGRTAHFIPPLAFAGVDFQMVNFTQGGGFAFRSPGFSVDGNGQTRFMNAILGNAGGGAVKLDVPSVIVTAVAVASGGGGGGTGTNDYFVGDILFGPNMGQYRVTAVTAGAVSGISLLTGGIATGTPPANPVATTGGSGTGCTLNLTWSTFPGALQLQSSGGPTTAGGTFVTNATSYLQAGSNVGANNVIRINPAASGNDTSIQVLGPDANTYLNILLQGDGYVQVPALTIAAGTVALSGAITPEQTSLYQAVAYTGTTTDSRDLNLLNISSDNAVVSGSAVNMRGWTMIHNYGGSAMTGGRIGLNVTLQQSAATQNNTSVYYQGLNLGAIATRPDLTGTTPTLNGGPFVFAAGCYAILQPTATGYSALAGHEQDIIVAAQPYGVLGFSAVRLTGGYSTNYQALEPSLDTAYKIGSQVANNATWVNGYTVTSPQAQFALDIVKGTAFKVFPGQDYATVKPGMAVGIDLSYAACSQYAWHSQGAKIDGSGVGFFSGLRLGNWSATVSSTGLTLGPGSTQIALTAAVASGGTLYNLNEQFSFATNGRGIVTSVSGQVVTGFTILEYPTSTSPPTNPVATTSLMFAGAGQSTGSGLTLNLTWSTANTLSLQPAGGPIVLPLLTNAANDAAAASAGVGVGQLYRNGSQVMQRVA